MTISSKLFVLWRFSCSAFADGAASAPKADSLSRIQMFRVRLTIADILVALANIFLQVAWDTTVQFEGGFVFRKVIKYALVLVLYLSTYILTSMPLDRLTNSTHLSRRNNHHSRIGYRKVAELLILVA
ncbi:vasopressin V1a receptor-like [Tropilaelaps mercedesae]|uniref:Vasopressin V1a receptor-like n=1 Tax=Tropilaelaps mercedesae TaxID=418985 RepID=A0A1V9XG53_9ACAR|nr:vasopressin V1a receptor-like [Tropilaelaps mercedesae]